MSRVAVIGGGISGIAAAYYLQQHGAEVDLYESGRSIGGRIGSESLDGRFVDFGGKNIGRKYSRFRDFVTELGGLDFEYFGFNTSQVVGGRVISLNKEKSRLRNLLRVFSLAGPGGVMKLMPMIQAVRKDLEQGFLNTPYFNAIADRYDDRSLASFFPESCVDHLVRPVTVRMNGAEPDECYPGNFGSNLALVLDSYEQLEQGMQALLQRFTQYSKSVKFCIGHEVRVCSFSDEKIVLHYAAGSESHSAEYSKVVVALPAVQAAALFQSSIPELASLLDRVTYFPVAVGIAKYHDAVFRGVQRAMVFDNSCSISNAGAYGINDLNLVRFTFSGQTARTVIDSETDPEYAVSLAEDTIAPYFNINNNTREAFVYRYVSPGLCAYSPFHYKMLQQIEQQLKGFRGLALTGDYFRGASIEACFKGAQEAIQKLMTGAGS